MARQPRIARLDRAAIAAEEHANVLADIAHISNRLDRLGRAGLIADKAEVEAHQLRPRRDAIALSLWAHDEVRAVDRIVGLARTRFYDLRMIAVGDIGVKADGTSWTDAELRAFARPKVERIAKAKAKIVAAADRVARAEARATAAREVRDKIVAELLAEGWDRVSISVRIGRNPSRISHIKRRIAEHAEVA